MNDDIININIIFNLDKATKTRLSIPMTILREDEESVRKAAKQVERLYVEYSTKFDSAIKRKAIAKEHLLAMVAYHLSRENMRLKDRNDKEPYTNKVKELTEELEDYIRQNEKI